MRIRPLLGVAALGLAAALPAAGPARADVLYSNLGPGNTYVQSIGSSENGPGSIEGGPIRQAVAFSPGPVSARFDDAQLGLSLSGGTNFISLRLYNDSGGHPGTVLEQLDAANQLPPFGSTNNQLLTFFSASHPLLVAGQTYWLLPFASSDTTAVWNRNNQSVSGPYALSMELEPIHWLVTPQLQGAVQVHGTVVPEPSTFALLGLGGAALVGWGRYRGRHAPAAGRCSSALRWV
jgi:hypothetical protein